MRSPTDSVPLRGRSLAAPELDAGQPAGIYLRYLSGLLRRHLWLMVAVLALTVGVTMLAAGLRSPRYRASAAVRIADIRGTFMEGFDIGVAKTPASEADPLLTKIEILRSRRVIGDAVDGLGFRLQPRSAPETAALLEDVSVGTSAADSIVLHFEATGVWAAAGRDTVTSPYGAPIQLAGVRFRVARRPAGRAGAVLGVLTREQAIQLLLRRLESVPRRQTDIVDVSYTAVDPLVAQRVVNQVVDAFQAADAEAAQQQARRRREFLGRQVARNDSILADAQLALSAFRGRSQTSGAATRVAAQEAALAGLEVRQQELEGQRRVFSVLLDQFEGGREGVERRDRLRVLMSSPGITTNPVVAHLYQQLLQYQTARDTLLSTGSPGTSPAARQLTALIASTEGQLVDAVRSHLVALQAQQASLDEIRTRTRAAIRTEAVPPGLEAEAVQLEQQAETARKLADLVREEYQKARIAEAVQGGQVEVVDLAVVPQGPLASNPWRAVALAVALGLVLGGALAYLRESMDSSIHVREELEGTANLPALAAIPHMEAANTPSLAAVAQTGRTDKRGGIRLPMRPRKSGSNGSAGATASSLQAALEPYRLLRTSLTYSETDPNSRSVVVTSALPGEGKSTTALNLAVVLAESGSRVLLIDCDFSRPSLHKLLRVTLAPGLAEVLSATVPLAAALRPSRVERLAFLPAGNLDARGVPALTREALARLLAETTPAFDRVVLDSPPVLLMANAVTLGAAADAVLLVVRSGKTERAAVLQAIDQLTLVGARVVGAVLNDADGSMANYGYAYRYTYGHGGYG